MDGAVTRKFSGERCLFWLTAVRAVAAMMLPVIMIHFPEGKPISEGGATPMWVTNLVTTCRIF